MAIITQERWLEAQKAEREFHDNEPVIEGIFHYLSSYRQYFSYLGLDMFDLKNKSIMEIGCADYPALAYCENYSNGVIIEPMPSQILRTLIKGKNIDVYAQTVESAELPKVDEVWIFNVMQHIIDPELFIEKIKGCSKIIRFFEPINTDYNICHPQSYTLDYFKSHFGNCVLHYPKNDNAINFHTWECAYGIFENN